MDPTNFRQAIVVALDDTNRVTQHLTALLAQIDGGDEAVVVPGQGTFTRSGFVTLVNNVAHLDGIRALFDVTAEHAGQTVLFSEVTARSGLSPKQQGNEHARMSRVASDLFGQRIWPVTCWQGPVAESGVAEMCYRMDPRVAEWWKAVRPA